MSYTELLKLYKNNEFREIDKSPDAGKFYLLRSLSKKKTLRELCLAISSPEDLDLILADKNVTEKTLIDFIKSRFRPKTDKEISKIEVELNKMQNFDWGGSAGNSLEKNIVNNVIKKTLKYNEIERALSGTIRRSVCGYTLNSWYNHWSSIMIEEIFNANEKIIPTIDLVEKIDFFISGVPFDLKVTYFPEELMKKEIADKLEASFGRRSEAACCKKTARETGIAIPADLPERPLTICLQNLFAESVEPAAKEFMTKLGKIKSEVYDDYIAAPNKLIKWLYENQGEMRFDAANRFYVVLIDKEKPFESWRLKRNLSLIKTAVNSKLDSFDGKNLNKVRFHWDKDGKDYECYSEMLFIYK